MGPRVQCKMVETIEWKSDVAGFGCVVMIDQRELPARQEFVICRTYEEVAGAIRTMVIRGAPAIGVAAAMGVALGVQQGADFETVCATLAATRPTAVNLFWGIERMRRLHAALAESERLPGMIAEAQQIRLEDIENLGVTRSLTVPMPLPDPAPNPIAADLSRASA